MFDVYTVRNPEEWNKCMFITGRDKLYSFYGEGMYKKRDKFFGPSASPWEENDEVGTYICSTNSLEDLEQSNPELFI